MLVFKKYELRPFLVVVSLLTLGRNVFVGQIGTYIT